MAAIALVHSPTISGSHRKSLWYDLMLDELLKRGHFTRTDRIVVPICEARHPISPKRGYKIEKTFPYRGRKRRNLRSVGVCDCYRQSSGKDNTGSCYGHMGG